MTQSFAITLFALDLIAKNWTQYGGCQTFGVKIYGQEETLEKKSY